MPNEVTQVIFNHRSIRSYTSDPIPDEILNDILTAAQWSPTSHNFQAYSIIVIKDPEAKIEVADFCRGQLWIKNCPVFLVFCMDYYRLKMACEKNGREMGVEEVENLLVGAVDTALAAQNAATAAESYGLGCVMIGGVRNHPEQISEYLKLPKYVVPIVGLSLGYPAETPWQKPRIPLRAVIHQEVYNGDEILQSAIDEYDAITKDYYSRRTEGKRTDCWSQQIADHFTKQARPHMKDFILRQGFNVK